MQSLALKFSEMTAERDLPPASVTEATVTPTGNGYIHEIVSKSSPHRRSGSTERVASVTRRQVVTTGDAAPRTGVLLHSTADLAASLQSSQAATVAAAQRPLYQPASTDTAAQWRNAASRPWEAGASPPPVPPPTGDASRSRVGGGGGGLRSTSSGRSVDFSGSVGTTMIEPARVSPLKVDTIYAPVRYVTRRQLQAELDSKRTLYPTSDLSSRIRTSSVPKVDSVRLDDVARRSASNSSRGSATQRHGSASRSAVAPLSEAEIRFRNQGPVAGFIPAERTGYERAESVGSRRSSVSSAGGGRSTPSQGGILPYRREIGRVASVPRGPTNLTLDQVSDNLLQMRGLSHALPAPDHAREAFALLHRGTYLIKYGRTGKPHERFFALRVMPDEFQRHHVFLLWALHSDSATISGRIHLSHLVGVARGTDARGYQMHLRSAASIVGPYVGSKPSLLPTTYAFSLVFQTANASRSVDLLALDDQTFRCWLLVCDYFAQINTTSGAGDAVGAEPLPPDSPRSSSSVGAS